MRELTQCLHDWHARDRGPEGAHAVLAALISLTLKLADSPRPDARDFDAMDIAQEARREDQGFEAAKNWVSRARPEQFMSARQSAIESFFREAGFRQALTLRRVSPKGKHRTVWRLEPYPLPVEASVAVHDIEVSDHGRDTLMQQVDIQYEYIPPERIRPAWFARLLLGRDGFVTRSWRGWLWVGLVVLAGCLLSLNLLGVVALQYARRPALLSDLAGLLLAVGASWVVWRTVVRPFIWLLEDRILAVSELWTAWGEETAQLELTRMPDRRQRLQLVRYCATCPVCAARVGLRHAEGSASRRLVGCCDDAPHEHVFSFDRVRRIGWRIRDGGRG